MYKLWNLIVSGKHSNVIKHHVAVTKWSFKAYFDLYSTHKVMIFYILPEQSTFYSTA